MLRPTYLLLCMALTLAVSAQRSRALEQVAYAMAGSYSSAEQAKADSSYQECELEVQRIWHKRKDGAWLYVEEATADNKEQALRQQVYHIKQVNDSTFMMDVLSIRNGAEFLGAYADAAKLLTLMPDSLQKLEGCSLTLHKRGPFYVGGTQGQYCRGQSDAAAYASSEMVITNESLVTWERGWNNEGKQVWGAEVGGTVFLKR